MQHSTIYVKALPLQELDDVETIKGEVRTGNILIVRITPLARKSVEETKLAITELTDYTKSLGGDIARLKERSPLFPFRTKLFPEHADVTVYYLSLIDSSTSGTTVLIPNMRLTF